MTLCWTFLFRAPLAAKGLDEPVTDEDDGGGGIPVGGPTVDSGTLFVGGNALGTGDWLEDDDGFEGGLFCSGVKFCIELPVSGGARRVGVMVGWSKKELGVLEAVLAKRFVDGGGFNADRLRFLISVEGVLEWLIGLKWLAVGGRTVMGCMPAKFEFKLKASLIKLFWLLPVWLKREVQNFLKYFVVF